jgi:hypothetical protein
VLGVTKTDQHLFVGDGDVVDGQAGDLVQRLGVEQDQQADDAFGRVQTGVAVEASDQLEPLLVADRAGQWAATAAAASGEP